MRLRSSALSRGENLLALTRWHRRAPCTPSDVDICRIQHRRSRPASLLLQPCMPQPLVPQPSMPQDLTRSIKTPAYLLQIVFHTQTYITHNNFSPKFTKISPIPIACASVRKVLGSRKLSFSLASEGTLSSLNYLLLHNQVLLLFSRASNSPNLLPFRPLFSRRSSIRSYTSALRAFLRLQSAAKPRRVPMTSTTTSSRRIQV
ncbi:hypothetical protein FB567DRAFT_523920 [Paraphoma chrysanthemicola]|uniref:Uncharacterized protein n=1 Tax=Paraphoma chrysanthemicola TaxID=798071 RepID=A0A8K0R5M0_9PLEO|nr:hypothetical protein FB567DRAFT_523920 [Paraphoma chrysanthemicola]